MRRAARLEIAIDVDAARFGIDGDGVAVVYVVLLVYTSNSIQIEDL